jgi:peptidoglycan hydrolase CwlO-like protein
MKTFRAILAALAVTAVIGIAMFVVGTNALANKNTLPITNSPQAAVTNINTVPSNNTQIAQLQALVKQYQDRDQQYQKELTDAAQKLTQANQQLAQQNQDLQQYQQLLMVLQQRGIIRVNQSGQIMIPRGSFSDNN